jgi:hypothetical protein
MPRRAGRAGAAYGSAFTNTIASVVTITIVDTVRNVSTAPSRITKPEP